MINKQRLEELINQCATIYYIDTSWINKNIRYVNSLTLDKRNHRVGYATYNFSLPEQENVVLKDITNDGYYHEGIARLQDIYEDIEEAKFNAEFKRVAKIQYLDIPTWEQAEKIDKLVVCEFDDWYRLQVCPSENIDNNGWIGIDCGGNCELYHWDSANEENYIEACKQFKRLFLGEENDE